MSERADLEIIADLVPPGSRVLDLGCGDGTLLAHLQRHRGCSGYGIEIDDANVQSCVQRGVNVIQLNLEVIINTDVAFYVFTVKLLCKIYTKVYGSFRP